MDTRYHIDLRTIHPTTADIAAADEILILAYDGERSRAVDLQRYLALQPDGLVLAMLDGAPVGVGGVFDYGPFASLGLMAVHPTAQRQGVGAAILAHLLQLLDGRSYSCVVLEATEAGAVLYKHFGFIDDGITLVFRQDAATREGPASAPAEDKSSAPAAGYGRAASCLSIAPFIAGDLPALVAFDAPLFGAARPLVLGAYLSADPSRTVVAREIAGYLCAQQRILGPWMAEDPTVAVALLAAVQDLSYPEGIISIVPDTTTDAAAVLGPAGLTPKGHLRTMRRGNPRPGRPGAVYGQASFALG